MDWLLPKGLAKIKVEIEKKIEDGLVDQASILLKSYEKEYPYDPDIISLHINIAIVEGELDNALLYANQGISRLPLDGDMYYNKGYVCNIKGDLINAYYNYSKAYWLYANSWIDRREELDLETTIDNMLQMIDQRLDSQDVSEKELIEYQQLVNNIIACERNSYGFHEAAFRSYDKVVGRFIQESLLSKRYIGIANDQFSRHYARFSGDDDTSDYDLDLIHLKGEMLYVQEGTGINIELDSIGEDIECIIPIASDCFNTVHLFERCGSEYQVVQHYDKYFSYYRIRNNTKIVSSKKSYYGTPIPLINSNKRKRLVLSIFVDGLSSEILQGDDFFKNMPYTYNYFKDGLICDNAYACGEWTYPSIANIVSGLYTSHHMMFHNEIDGMLPYSVPTLAEYYKEQGYYTALISSDWRIIPTYGYGRGVDRYIYQNMKCGYRVENIVGDAIDHIEAFKETDQYLWLSIGDLHDISDGDDTSIDVQSHTPIELRSYGDVGKTSVKQNYSENKTKQYLKYVKHVDMWLNVLYNYIAEHYEDKEVVVSLFADHGQGYMIPEGRTFLSKERTKVAFMFKGGMSGGGKRTQELISTVDYGCIMRKLCNITDKNVAIDGQLPKIFGGAKERTYTLTESLHPGDSYQLVLNEDNVSYYFINPEPVRGDGRIMPGEYRHWMEDRNGNRINDNELLSMHYEIAKNHILPLLVYE